MQVTAGHVHGLIPAHAGKTASPRHAPPSAEAHPRSRGENGTEEVDGNRRCGSSPLTRGKHLVTRSVLVSSGLIPAHAGKTPVQQGALGLAAAHPRSRGENLFQTTRSCG